MFKVGDLVWTKVRGFPPWPGIVMNPNEKSGKEPKKPSQWVFNFGTEDWYWVNINNIELYDPENVVLSKRLPMGFRDKYKIGCEAIHDVYIWGTKSPFYPDEYHERSDDNTKVTDAHKRLSEDTEERKVKKSKRAADSTSENLNEISSFLLRKKIEPSKLRFGFLGLGETGYAIVKNLLHSKHKVTIFDEDMDKIKAFVSIGAIAGESPRDVVRKSDITFSCFSDVSTAKEMLLGKHGAHSGIDISKSFVEMTPKDIKTSEIFADLIHSKGGKYLEAQIFGNVIEALDGMILILSGGDQELYHRCHSCFKAVSKCSYYLGEVGMGVKMSHCLHLLSGIFLVGLFEAQRLGDAMDLDFDVLMEVLQETKIEVPRISGDLKNAKLDNNEILKHISQMSLAQSSSNSLSLAIPLGSTANEVLKQSLPRGFDSF